MSNYLLLMQGDFPNICQAVIIQVNIRNWFIRDLVKGLVQGTLKLLQLTEKGYNVYLPRAQHSITLSSTSNSVSVWLNIQIKTRLGLDWGAFSVSFYNPVSAVISGEVMGGGSRAFLDQSYCLGLIWGWFDTSFEMSVILTFVLFPDY